MGGSESTASSTLAWRILDVLPNSPCETLGLIPYFDFVVGCDGYRLSMQADNPFEDLIHGKSSVVLTIFNYKTRVKRDITVSPSADGSLGLILVPCDFASCDDYCIRLVNVSEKNCPAASIGLSNPSSNHANAEVENSIADSSHSSLTSTIGVDYLLGTPVECFTSVSRFRSIISDFEDETLPVWVYRSTTAELWKTVVIPTWNWRTNDNQPATGLLGCDIGSGFLHKLPALRDDQTEIRLLSPPVTAADTPKVVTSDRTESGGDVVSSSSVGRVITETSPVSVIPDAVAAVTSSSTVVPSTHSASDSAPLSFPSPPSMNVSLKKDGTELASSMVISSDTIHSSELDQKMVEVGS